MIFAGIGQQWAFSQGGYWTEQQWVVGDFNGDGKDDLAKPFDNRNRLANIDVHLSGGYYFTMERWANGQGGFWDSQKWLAGDFNGDGKDDMAKVFNDGGLATIDVHLSSGQGFTMQRWTTREGGFWDSQRWLVGDFNGDGKDDMGKAFNDNGLATIDVHLSSGQGFTMQRAVTRQGTFSADQQWLVGDFNGDGKDEFTKAFNDQGFASVDVYI
ncbi:FG-GAP repeat domain-containing protein [Dolichospermum circinale]|uniref:FG-GAP repeat domain-containing protein n=1 Tax=Dolichospermum circinale TaxID=109265 RepID=UPI002330160C|nr:VCBS repeat-containing protein [Dolichospermum circinale]MDB9448708.1 VCBS repeat-containing protein [Dolichospermum circinale CS-547]